MFLKGRWRIESTILQTLSQGLSSIIGAGVKDFICTDIQKNTNQTKTLVIQAVICV